ncbi:hypothetical protein DWV84_13215 [Blautia sp. AF13-16]|nr:hypothetical protein C3R19_08185 [Blautia producta]RHP81257.1 hypothetical protein DXA40_09455 [Blautia sp. OF01-4LB]RHS15347.1 hypothetical protein DWV84_13215 [Blautia sp. AF13-16]
MERWILYLKVKMRCSMKNNGKNPRRPTKTEALSCLAVMIAVMLTGTVKGFDISISLFITAAYVGVIGLRCGFTLHELLEAMYQKAGELTDLFFLLCGIGFLTASFIFAGTIPALITYLLAFVTPGLCILFGFLFTAVTAFFIGTSFGTCGTIGVAMMGLAIVMDVNLAAMAGAVVSGSHVGLFFSPMADNFNLVVSVTKTDSLTVMKRAAYIGIPTFAACIIFYSVLGVLSGSANSAFDHSMLSEGLASVFHISPIALIPIIVVVAGSFLHLPSVVSLFGGGLIGILIGTLLNGFSIWKGLAAGYHGFDLTAVTGISADAVLPEIVTLCNRGGMLSMSSLFVILFAAVGAAGIMIRIKAVEVIVETLFGRIRSVFGLAVSSWCIGTITGGITNSSALSILMPVEMLEEKYREFGYSSLDCAVVANTAASPMLSIIPWTDVALYMSGVVGVQAAVYAPYSMWSWGLGVMSIICSILKAGYHKDRAHEV